MAFRPRPGFPLTILMPNDEIVLADPLLPTAAHFLQGMPPSARVSPFDLADGLDVPEWRADAILEQLWPLGWVGEIGEDGERPIFDPDMGPTYPMPLYIGLPPTIDAGAPEQRASSRDCAKVASCSPRTRDPRFTRDSQLSATTARYHSLSRSIPVRSGDPGHVRPRWFQWLGPLSPRQSAESA